MNNQNFARLNTAYTLKNGVLNFGVADANMVGKVPEALFDWPGKGNWTLS